MTFALALSAVRWHPFSVGLTAFIVVLAASLLGVSAPLALVTWTVASVVAVELWCVLEPGILQRVGHLRPPTHEEAQRLEPIAAKAQLEPLVAETSDLFAERGLRVLAVGRDYFDLFEDRPLSGLLIQSAAAVHSSNLAGYLIVWLGASPLLGMWYVSRGLVQLGRLLGVVVGASLIVPLVLWPSGWVRWSGRIFGSVFVVLLGAMSLSSGLAAAGLGLLVAWAAIPGLATLLAWESRRIERAGDLATIQAGFGPQLLEALELLLVAEPRLQLTGLLGLLSRPGSRLVDRAAFIRRTLPAS